MFQFGFSDSFLYDSLSQLNMQGCKAQFGKQVFYHHNTAVAHHVFNIERCIVHAS